MIVCKGSHALTEFFFSFLTTLFNQISRSPMWATVNPLLSPPGGLFFSSSFEGGGLKREGRLI